MIKWINAIKDDIYHIQSFLYEVKKISTRNIAWFYTELLSDSFHYNAALCTYRALKNSH